MQFRFGSFPWFESLILNSWFKSQKQKYLNHNSWFKSHFPPGTGTSRRVGARGCTIWRDFHTSPCLWSTHKSLVWIWASMASCARSFPPAGPCTARRERCYPMSKVSPASQWRLNLRLWHVSQLQQAKMRCLHCVWAAWGSERTRSLSCAAGPTWHIWPETRAWARPVACFWSLLPPPHLPMRRHPVRPAARTIRRRRSWSRVLLNQKIRFRSKKAIWIVIYRHMI